MKTETYITIVEEVRSQKEAVAARHDFNVARIVADARQRQERSGRRVIRHEDQDEGGTEATLAGS